MDPLTEDEKDRLLDALNDLLDHGESSEIINRLAPDKARELIALAKVTL